METRVFTADNIKEAARLIIQGGLLAVPTETVYGLAGNGLSPEAVAEIYNVKGRAEDKPLSLMVSSAESIDKYCLDIPETAYFLADEFWPGPLTIILKARPEIPEIVIAGGTTVGLRCPDNPLTLELLRLTGLPLAAPSANPSDEPPAVNLSEVLGYFNGKIPGV
jgi:L-threonylcarbamoyladenylate synthase